MSARCVADMRLLWRGGRPDAPGASPRATLYPPLSSEHAMSCHSPAPTATSAPTGVTIGNFDGVHQGHQALVRRALAVCRSRGLVCTAVTFTPHPRTVLRPDLPHAPLTTPAERAALLRALGVDRVVEIPFTTALAALSPEDFIRRHLLPLGMVELIIGHDFSLGRGREGRPDVLRELGLALGFGVEQVPAFTAQGEAVSSTGVRRCLAAGQVAEAAELLGRPYALEGTVGHGEGRGTSLGFPTANLHGCATMLPACGVYAGRATLGGRTSACVTNIGHKPTFGGTALTVESFLLDASGDFYGQPLRLEFLARLRDERRFASPDALRRQINDDTAQARLVVVPSADSADSTQ